MTRTEDRDQLFPGSNRTFVLLGLALLVAAILFFREGNSKAHIRHTVAHVESVIHESEECIEIDLKRFESVSVDSLFHEFNATRTDLEASGLSYFIFESDSLVAWSTNSIPLSDRLDKLIEAGPCILLPNGWYLIKEHRVEGRRIFGLFLIKYEYLYQNKYLVNQFHPRFYTEEKAEILSTARDGAMAVKDSQGLEIFYLSGQVEGDSTSARGMMVLACLVLFLFFFIKFFFAKLYARSDSMGMLWIGVLAVCAVRLLMLFSRWPWSLAEIGVFDPSVYAHSFLYPSLADLVINAFLLLMLAYVFKEWLKRTSFRLPFWSLPLAIVGFFMLARMLDSLFKSLIQDSNIQFNISNFFELDLYSVFGVIGVSMLLIAMLFLAQVFVDFIRSKHFPIKVLVISALVLLLLIILVNHGMGVVDMIKVLWPFVLLTYLFLTHGSRNSGTRLVYILGAMAILSYYAAHIFEKNVVLKDREKLEVVAERLMEGGDPVAEYLFEDMKSAIQGDSLLWQSLANEQLGVERILTLLRTEYFNGYWTKYEMDIETFSSHGPYSGYDFIQDSTRLQLYKVPDTELELNYIVKLAPLSSKRTFLVLFRLDIIPEELGFPELLIEGNSIIGDQLSRYSFARYMSGELVHRYGDFDYTLKEPEFPVNSKYYEAKDFWHFPFSRGDDAYVISSPRKSFMNRLTTFTYLFSFLGLFIGLAYLVEKAFFEGKWPRPDLQNKVQFLVVGILFTSLLVFGVGAYYYILSQNRANNEGILSEKVSSVLIELSHKLEKEDALGNQEKLELYLDKFSKVFFTDINLYTLEGRLMASSRPLVFSRGLISSQMDPQAYQHLALDFESRYIHEELIGELEYLSAYVPFVNSKNEVLAYLNLPYFAKQTELEDELSRFLVAVVNILVLLFVLAILVAVLVSNWITRPLQLLKENLATMRLDRRNEPIVYEGSDEIASLVTEYNSKVEELQENAELLAKSERESAWREMAKQVAHEIKNPLTPMKLSIQYLQRSQADKGPDWEDRFKRSTDMLIEQIDTLSSIATAFSDFAKMPKAINEHFPIAGLVQQVADLFSEEPDADIELLMAVPDDAEVFVDRVQVTRLLTNLMKNAIQSIPDEREGEITLSLIAKGYQYIIEVKDNGIGIPEEMRERIFVPNFTTKSTGTGLGLAMCKNIVEQAGGSIWFTTKLDVGTSFYVSLPQP